MNFIEDYNIPNDLLDVLTDNVKIYLNNYELIDTRKELKKSNNKKAIPSNVLEWCKDGNGYHVFEELKQLATWLNKLTGRNFVGGTSIGKSPQTLILDITYQGSEVYVNSDEIKLKGEIVENYKEFKTVFEKHFKIIG